jgi:hypothetical protein
VTSHLSSIGFSLDDPESLADLIDRLSSAVEVFEVRDGRYLRWTSDCGAELWLQVNEEQELVGLMPYFSGTSRWEAALTGRIQRPHESPMDGAFQAWANPPDYDAESGDYPFVFDCPDYALYAAVELPHRSLVGVVAFAHHVVAYASPDAFLADQQEDPKFSSEFFLPTGFLAEGDQAALHPEAQAMCAGTILETRQCENPITRIRFHWAKIQTLGGEIDLVAHPSLVEGTLRVGGVARGVFWLTGRLVDYAPSVARGFAGLH